MLLKGIKGRRTKEYKTKRKNNLMDIEKLREICLAKKGVTEEFPFDADTLVFKVGGKMFSLVSINDPDSCLLKCDPQRAVELREEHHQIKEGYHMNKKHWNSVYFEGNMPDSLFIELIDHSYDLVFKGLTKSAKEQVGNM